MDWLAQFKIIGEVALAMFLGGIIGVEREMADKPAGFRTHMIVAGSAAMLVGIGMGVMQSFHVYTSENDSLRADPIRIIEAIITGISFLGAGTIFRRDKEDHVEGLTTASTILLSAAIGIAVAVQQIVLAVGGTLLGLGILRGLHILEKWVERKKSKRTQP